MADAVDTNSWLHSTSQSGLVRVGGTHCLNLRVSGPSRTSLNTPVVIAEAGLGDCSVTWSAVVRKVQSFARIYTYDRSGLGRSEPAPGHSGSAESAVNELHELLINAGVKPPYVLVGHSLGGVLARVFLDMFADEVVGMVLVDTIPTLETHAYKSAPFEHFDSVIGGLDEFIKVTGLADNHQLTMEEWDVKRGLNRSEQNNTAEAAESTAFDGNLERLEAKKQFERMPMGNKPLSVIMADQATEYGTAIRAGVKAGRGTPEGRESMMTMLEGYAEREEGFQRQLLQLSSKSRFARALKSGHNVQLTEPEVVAEEISWVLGEIAKTCQ